MTAEVEAAAEQVWPVIADVKRWPEWTASISSAELLTERNLALASRVRVRQPKFPAMIWRVIDFQAGRSFTWQVKSPGLTSTASHIVEPEGPGRSRVTLRIEQTGLLEPVIKALTGKRTREYVAMELAGLKRRYEETAKA